jgi:hypothetical protein
MVGGSFPIEPSDLNYSTITPTINKEIGFSFSGPLDATSPEGSAQVTLGYLITGPHITYAGAALTDFSSGTDVGFFGIATLMETISPGGSLNAQIEGFCPGVPPGGEFPSPCDVSGVTATDAVTFSPVDEVAVSETVSVEAPPVNHGGGASLDAFNNISQVPEPGTLLLFGTGLLLIGTIGRKLLHA